MKSKTALVLVLSSLMSISAFAKVKTVTTCSNGEEINLKLKQTSQGVYQADVTLQSVGDSYPSYHFKNLQLEARPRNFRQAPFVYSGEGFKLTIAKEVLVTRVMADIVDAPSIGLNNATIGCKK